MSLDPFIRIRGAREHNLQSIDLDLPRGKFIVITGLSGSGKSSLAFDTICAEGQRRYMESLSTYARQFLDSMKKPDVDSIDGLSPSISIEQKTTSRNPRSTVATVTEIYDYMRLLWSRIGIPHSPTTGLPIVSQTPTQMVDRLLAMPENTRLLLLAPVVRGRKGEFRRELESWQRAGFMRVRVNGDLIDLTEIKPLKKTIKHSIDIVVDRVIIQPDARARLADSTETALGLADGLMIAEAADSGEQTRFSSRYSCPESGFSIEEIEPRLFSFNSPFGSCPACVGLGSDLTLNPDLVVPDPTLKVLEDAIAPWSRSSSSSSQASMAPWYHKMIAAVLDHFEAPHDATFAELDPTVQKAVLYGTKERISFVWEHNNSSRTFKRRFEGVIPNLERRYRETDSSTIQEEIDRYMTTEPCSVCEGKRLKPEALAVKINGKDISEVSYISVGDALFWFGGLMNTFDANQKTIAEPILREILERLGFLQDVGLGYLTLGRTAGTLSGGESQRIRLASQIGSGLSGVLYVLDEPSIGLHQRDNERLLATLIRLRDLGNTVIVVEHDEEAIRAADYVVDLGPLAGIHGGRICAKGTPDEIRAATNSLTGDYLAGRKQIPIPEQRRSKDSERVLSLTGASGHNLKHIDLELPLGCLVAITGVSGSGKSTLILETLQQVLAKVLMGTQTQPAPYGTIKGAEHLDKIVDINQSPIGRTPRSNPATYVGAFGPIRDWFANLPEARARGYKPGRFSFNVKGGRCEACQGDGLIKIEMHFLPDVYVECSECKGRRYNRETLEVTWQGLSIADVLALDIETAAERFDAIPAIRDRMHTLVRVGLGYIRLGQSATTLSGGEAQRVKLSKELSRRATGKTLYVLDEPTTGLHSEDVRKLLEILQRLVDQGNSVVVIEHHIDVIKAADWVVDLGPEGGDGGGRIIAQGTPEMVASEPLSLTGKFLAPLLERTR